MKTPLLIALNWKTVRWGTVLRNAWVVVMLISLALPVFSQEETTPKRGEINSNDEPKDGSVTSVKDQSKDKKDNSNSDIKTLFGNGKATHGGFGGISVYYTEFNKKSGLLVGGRGGWIINHCISLGMGGYGITNNIYYNDIVPDSQVTLNGGYGGMYIELIAFPKKPVHISFPILVGVGGVAYSIKNKDFERERDEDDLYDFIDNDAFFVIEPGVEIELNVLRNFRIAFGASYRYLGDLDIQETKSDAFDGIAGGVTFKFGKF